MISIHLLVDDEAQDDARLDGGGHDPKRIMFPGDRETDRQEGTSKMNPRRRWKMRNNNRRENRNGMSERGYMILHVSYRVSSTSFIFPFFILEPHLMIHSSSLLLVVHPVWPSSSSKVRLSEYHIFYIWEVLIFISKYCKSDYSKPHSIHSFKTESEKKL